MSDKAHWLEVSLSVDGEAAEAVADVLARYVPHGVVIESTAVTADDFDEGHAIGRMTVRGYLPADDSLAQTRQGLEEALWHLGQLTALPAPEFRPVPEQSWVDAWKQHHRPVRVGRHLVITPTWIEPPLQPDDVAIRLDPGMAFGTGTHPSTQLCLQAIEDTLRPGCRVLDLGCGSGILAIAAARLGAGSVVALDTDTDAVRVAEANLAANGVAPVVQVAQGSLRELLTGPFNGQVWDLVVANILAPILAQLLDQGLARVVAPDGTLILSGILQHQLSDVEAAVRRAGHERLRIARSGEWVVVVSSR